MQLDNDDEIRAINATFLGGTGWDLPWTARYVAYGIAAPLMILALLVERRLGIGLGVWSLVYTVAAVVALTRYIGRRITYEVPARAVLAMFWHEINAPRPQVKGQRVVLRPRQVKVGA